MPLRRLMPQSHKEALARGRKTRAKSFKTFIRKRYNRADGPRGSFTRTVLRVAGDPANPLSGKSWLVWLKETKFTREQRQVFKTIWAKYIAWRKKKAASND